MSIARPLALVALLAITTGATAEAVQLQVGDKLPTLAINDQFDKPFAIGDDAELLLFSASMDASKLVNETLTAAGARCYDSAAVRYVADISGMPSFITKTIALPKMRKRPFRIGLVRNALDGAMIPRQEDQVSLLSLTQGKVERIEFAASEAELKAALAKTCEATQP